MSYGYLRVFKTINLLQLITCTCESKVTFHSSFPRKKNIWHILNKCEGVFLQKSGNKETLDFVKPRKSSRNRGFFYANSLFLLILLYRSKCL